MLDMQPGSNKTKSPLKSPLASKSRKQSPNEQHDSEIITLTRIVKVHPSAFLIHLLK